MPYTIAVIDNNKCNFEKMTEFALPLLYKPHTSEESKRLKNLLNDYLWSEISKFITFIDIEHLEDVLPVGCRIITEDMDHPMDHFYFHTESSYSYPKKYLEIIHCQPMWKEYVAEQPENVNSLGCLFSLKHSIIENKCVIIASKYIEQEPKMALDSISKDDILRVIRRRYFNTAILIKENEMVKYYYQNASYLISQIYNLTEKDNIQTLPITLFKYNLKFCFQYDKNKYVNKIGTRINGLYKLYGDVIMFHELEDNIYGNLSLREAKRLNVLSYGRLYDRQLKDSEFIAPQDAVDAEGKEKKVTPIWSRYVIIENRMKKYKNCCINCDKILNTGIITCQYCYRIKYCSTKCEEEFNVLHYEDCLKSALFN